MQAKNKTTQNKIDVADFLQNIADPQQKADCLEICRIMETASGERPAMWGPSIVGFGFLHLVYPSGRELDWHYCSFAPRKGQISLGFWQPDSAKFEAEIKNLGKYKRGVGCIYVKKLDDIDLKCLANLVRITVETHQK